MSEATLSQKTYEFIHGKILAGDYPPGSVLSELSLAKVTGTSRTPVREAIRRLTAEGLVEQVPRYGTIVRVPDRRDLTELYEIREALESFAAAAAVQHISAGDLQTLAGLIGEMQATEKECRRNKGVMDEKTLHRFLAADLAFHMLLIRVGGNRRIMRIVADTQALTRIFGTRRQVHNPAVVAKACRFHREILLALEQRTPGKARWWMARHIRASRRQMLECFDHQENHIGEPIPLPIPDYLRKEFQRFNLDVEKSPPPKSKR